MPKLLYLWITVSENLLPGIRTSRSFPA